MTNHKIILFDGVCNFCNSTINFVIRKDIEDKFRFASLQGETGKLLLEKYKIDTLATDSIVLIENDKAYTKSTAALHIARGLKGWYSLLYGFMIIPKFLRNTIYDYVARNRYKWFGKKDSCMLPNPSIKTKFIDI
tara:strand:- start:294 stop:698 length:405 start_codon:yes stop_codon:yes gene_type:complete